MIGLLPLPEQSSPEIAEPRIKRTRSIRFYAVALVLITAIPLLAGAVLNALNEVERIEAATLEEVRQAANEASLDVSRWLASSQDLLAAIAVRPATANLECELWIRDFIQTGPEYSAYLLITPSGEEVCHFGKNPYRTPPAADILASSWFQTAVATDGPFTTYARLAPTTQKWVTQIGLPVRGADGRVAAYAVLVVYLEQTAQRLFKGRQRQKVINVFDENKVRLMRWPDPEEWIGKALVETNTAEPLREGRVLVATPSGDRIEMIAAAVRVEGASNWRLAVSLPASEVALSVRSSVLRVVGILSVITALIALAAFYGSQFFSRPIQAIARLASAAVGGQPLPDFSLSRVPTEILETARALVRMNQSIAASEERYRDLLNRTNTVVWEANAKTFKMAFLSDQARLLLGYAPSEWRTAQFNWIRHIHPEDIDAAIKDTQDGIARGGSWQQSCRFIRRDKRIVWVRNLCTVAPNDGVIRGLTFDITKQVELERALAINDARNRSIIDASPVPSMLVANNRNIVFLNAAFGATFGYTLEDIPTLKDWALEAYPDAKYRRWIEEETVKRAKTVTSAGLTYRQIDVEVRAKDGRVLNISIEGKEVQVANEFCHLLTLVNVTDRVKAGVALREASARYQEIIEASPLPFALYNNGVFEFLNSAFVETFGYDLNDIPTLTEWYDRAYPDLALQVERRAKSIETFSKSRASLAAGLRATVPADPKPLTIRTKDGRNVVVLSYFTALSVTDQRLLMSYVDVTDRVEMQDRLAQSEKLAAVGQLTGGVAHDVNNDLAVVLGSAELIQDMAEPGSRLEVLSKRIIGTVQRSANLVQRMLTFSRKANIEPIKLDLSKTVGEVVETMRRTLEGRVELRYTPTALPLWVNVDRSMLESALINLAVNARDAMPDGGALTFALNAERREDIEGSSDWVVVSVTDTGIGMSEETRKRVFEPFFTTKPMGGGTGLGLATVYGFVKQSGGDVDVQSTRGAGSTFTIRLPQVQPPESPQQQFAGDKDQPGRHQIVLLVEDNMMLRMTLKEQLQDIGCKVIEAGSVDEAIAAIGQHPSLTFILSDLDLGAGPSGVDLAEWVKRQGHHIPGAIISGYLSTPIKRITAAGWTRLQKPVQIKEVAKLF